MRDRGVFIRFGGREPDWSFETLALRFAINLLGLWLADALVPGIQIGDVPSLVAVTAIFAIVNVLLRPLAYVMSCCLIVATFGLFVLVVNAALLGVTAWVAGGLGLSMDIDGFWSAFFGALIISVVSLTASLIVRRRV